MSSIPSRNRNTPRARNLDIAALVPDFPFHYGEFLGGTAPLPSLFDFSRGEKNKRVLVVGAGAAGAVAAYELLRMGLKPILVEASNRYGGRLNAQHLGGTQHEVIAELGAMRFPASGKAGRHYFEKARMLANSAPFPNPGSAAAVSTVVDYQGRQEYYEYESEDYPIPEKYVELEDDMFGNPQAGKEGFLDKAPVFLSKVQDYMTEGNVDQKRIKEIWNALLTKNGWDDISFYAALTQISPWSPADINLFGQIGFGTGGWNTDYPNCILEVLRVLYTGLDVDHRLMFDGTTALPTKLIIETPEALEDNSDPSTANLSVKITSEEFLGEFFSSRTSLGKEVRHIARNLITNKLDAIIHDIGSGEGKSIGFDAIIYTPHVRILDKFRHYGTGGEYRRATQLLHPDMWEAVEYTHYMQSAKIFMATTSPFWKDRLPSDDDTPGKFPMSVTLSDRLTRGSYLIDYGDNDQPDGVKGSGIFLSYTWNDDSLKFLGDRNDEALLTHAHMCRTVLQDIYPNLRLNDYLAPGGSAEVEINWENEPLYLGAFKMNLPGQYEYQRRLFSQFMTGVKEGHPDPFVLAGDDISWTAGWVEGAITSAINAINKIAFMFGGADWEGQQGPIARWDELKPIELPTPKLAGVRRLRQKQSEPSEAI